MEGLKQARRSHSGGAALRDFRTIPDGWPSYGGLAVGLYACFFCFCLAKSHRKCPLDQWSVLPSGVIRRGVQCPRVVTTLARSHLSIANKSCHVIYYSLCSSSFLLLRSTSVVYNYYKEVCWASLVIRTRDVRL